MVIPALGVGASTSHRDRSLRARAPVTCPASPRRRRGTPSRVHDGERWLGPDSMDQASVQGYRQTIDMRTATARTAYEWVDGIEAHVGPGRDLHLACLSGPRGDAARAASRTRPDGCGVRFALAGWPRRPGCRSTRSRAPQPGWGPTELWYPGHMVVRSRTARQRTDRLRLPVARRESRRTEHPSSPRRPRSRWPRDLPGAKVHVRASGDTASVEVAFDAVAGRPYVFTQLVGFATSGGDAATRSAVAAPPRGRGAGARLRRARRPPTRGAWARRWETDIVLDGNPELQRVVRSMLFYLLCSADSGTAMGIPPMGLSSGGYYGHIFWDSDTWMFPAAAAHPSGRRPLDGGLPRPHAARRGGQRAGERLPRRPVSVGGRRARRRDHAALRRAERQLRDPRERRRRPRPVAVLPRHRRLRVARARRVSRHPRNRGLLGEPRRATTPPAAATTFGRSSRWPRGSSA